MHNYKTNKAINSTVNFNTQTIKTPRRNKPEKFIFFIKHKSLLKRKCQTQKSDTSIGVTTNIYSLLYLKQAINDN